jgi:cyclopropane fatty-acyl-phospholipid synthase-like methyltransferase
MDDTLYWSVAERNLEIQHPISGEKLGLLETYLGLHGGCRVLDIGCGKGWLLREWAKRHSINGVGVETNASFLKIARRDAGDLVGRLEFVESSGLDYQAPANSFDVTVCLGASFDLKEFAVTVDRLSEMTRVGGMTAIAELVEVHPAPHARFHQHPPTLADTIGVLRRHDFEVTALISSADDEFERYASAHRHAIAAWATANPNHPGRAEMVAQSQSDWLFYLETVRPHLGWTIFIARRVAAKTFA